MHIKKLDGHIIRGRLDMINIVQKAKVACMLPVYINREVFSERVKNIEEAPETENVIVEKDSVSKEIFLRFKGERFNISHEDLKINATFDPSIVVYTEGFLPNRYVAILMLNFEFPHDLELSILLKFLDVFRRLQTDKCFSVTGLCTDTLQLSPNDIIQFFLDNAVLIPEMIEGINKMITFQIVVMATTPSDDDLYNLATISDPDEILTSTYVGKFLEENAYKRWKNSGTTLVFHRNAGAFVFDGSNKNFKEWVSKKPKALDGSIERRIHMARLLVFQKAVLHYFRIDIINNFRNLRLDKDRQGLINRIGEVREYMLQFSNRYRYSEEIGEGTMAVEIMKMWRRVMLIDALFSEVYEKLSELEQYMVTIATNDQTRAISWLQLIFVGGTAGSIAISLLTQTSNWKFSLLVTVTTSVCFGFLTWILLKRSKAL